MNERVTKKERGLIKGALRRVFSRSELRKSALNACDIEHSDPKRPRVKKWSRCTHCKAPTPKYLMEVDHVEPVVKVTEASADLDANTLVNRIWCPPINLVGTCKKCHTKKTASETKERAKNKREKK